MNSKPLIVYKQLELIPLSLLEHPNTSLIHSGATYPVYTYSKVPMDYMYDNLIAKHTLMMVFFDPEPELKTYLTLLGIKVFELTEDRFIETFIRLHKGLITCAELKL